MGAERGGECSCGESMRLTCALRVGGVPFGLIAGFGDLFLYFWAPLQSSPWRVKHHFKTSSNSQASFLPYSLSHSSHKLASVTNSCAYLQTPSLFPIANSCITRNHGEQCKRLNRSSKKLTVNSGRINYCLQHGQREFLNFEATGAAANDRVAPEIHEVGPKGSSLG